MFFLILILINTCAGCALIVAKETVKAIDVILEVAERKKDQVLTEPEEKMWKMHLESLLVARECIEEDIPYLNPNY